MRSKKLAQKIYASRGCCKMYANQFWWPQRALVGKVNNAWIVSHLLVTLKALKTQ